MCICLGVREACCEDLDTDAFPRRCHRPLLCKRRPEKRSANITFATTFRPVGFRQAYILTADRSLLFVVSIKLFFCLGSGHITKNEIVFRRCSLGTWKVTRLLYDCGQVLRMLAVFFTHLQAHDIVGHIISTVSGPSSEQPGSNQQGTKHARTEAVFCHRSGVGDRFGGRRVWLEPLAELWVMIVLAPGNALHMPCSVYAMGEKSSCMLWLQSRCVHDT